MDLQQAIQESKLAIDYFFNNRFEEARALMKPELSIYHAVGHSVFLFLEAMLTFVSCWNVNFYLQKFPTKQCFYSLGTSKYRNSIERSQAVPAYLQQASTQSNDLREHRENLQKTKLRKLYGSWGSCRALLSRSALAQGNVDVCRRRDTCLPHQGRNEN